MRALQQRLPDQCEFDLLRDPGTTGNFEVFIGSEGKLVHSKRNGDGHVSGEKHLQRILNEIMLAKANEGETAMQRK